jgi:methylase of polypeptide subunit release factors
MIPEITKQMMEYMQSEKSFQKYQFGEIALTLKPYAFPPQSEFSRSTYCLQQSLRDLGDKVLDLGTGAGLFAMLASKQAKEVHAVDISPDAVRMCKDNCKKNGIKNVKAYQSNMFENVTGTYDTIIGNLPIVELPLPDNNPLWYSLFDPDFKAHKALFSKVSSYQNPKSKIVLCHADLQPDGFKKLEVLADKYKFNFDIDFRCNELGHEWRTYIFRK